MHLHTMSIHSLEGQIIVVIIFVESVIIATLYYLLMNERHKLRERNRHYAPLKAIHTRPKAPATPIITGQIESLPKARADKIPMTAPPSKAKAILGKVSPIVKIVYQRVRAISMSIKENRTGL